MFRFFVLFGALVAALSAPAQAADLQNVLYLDLASGRVVIEMRPDIAPAHVARIKELVRSKFYNGLTFHRVIERADASRARRRPQTRTCGSSAASSTRFSRPSGTAISKGWSPSWIRRSCSGQMAERLRA